MVTLASSQHKESNLSDAVNGFPGENTFNDLRFRLINKLQSTLDLKTTLELFHANIYDLVPVDGLFYESAEKQLRVSCGKTSKNKATYNVKSSNTNLGKITFCRENKFEENELNTIEVLLSVLFYPLRNALKYREALESSMRDPLTGIGNRAAMENSFQREIKLSQRHQQPLSLLLIDIDHFKKINDSVGHNNGDKALKHVARSIQSALRETDQIFRFGGEEFVALLHNTNRKESRLVAERIRVNIALTPVPLKEQNLYITASIGASTLEQNEKDESFFERADKALYRAKHEGRNCVRIAESSTAKPTKDII